MARTLKKPSLRFQGESSCGMIVWMLKGSQLLTKRSTISMCKILNSRGEIRRRRRKNLKGRRIGFDEIKLFKLSIQYKIFL